MSTPHDPASGGARLDADRFAGAVAARTEAGDDPATALCAAGADVLDLTGAGIMLRSGTRLDCVAVSDDLTGTIEALELMVGEGPCLDAFRTGTACFDTDLEDDRPVSWTAFREAALTAGVRAAFGFPVVVGDDCIGVLNFYRDRAGALSPGQVAAGHTVAGISGRTIVSWQADAPPGTLAWQLEGSGGHQVVVHQAVGRVSVQAGVTVDDAMAMLQAHAFAHGVTIREVATDVLEGRLRFDA
jgi:GAF domain/ANTAR domain